MQKRIGLSNSYSPNSVYAEVALLVSYHGYISIGKTLGLETYYKSLLWYYSSEQTKMEDLSLKMRFAHMSPK